MEIGSGRGKTGSGRRLASPRVPDHIPSRRSWKRRHCGPAGPKKNFADGRGGGRRSVILITDTRSAYAHQSLDGHAGPDRTQTARSRQFRGAQAAHNLYSLEMWGGATCDVAMPLSGRSVAASQQPDAKSDPNICFQMLLRASTPRLFGLSTTSSKRLFWRRRRRD